VGATADDAATTGRASDDLDAAQQALVDEGPIPSHIAIIMDGNGRWAREQGQARAQGHREGVSSVRDVTEACAALGVGYLTLYTFSTENWHRPQQEVDALMHLLVHTIERERATLMDNGIRLRVLGDTSRLPAACREQLASTCKATAANDRMTLNLALSYSGRWDLVQAMRRIAAAVEAGTLHADAVDDACISRHLTTAGMPDPDLLIRTGGEYRLSNFLLWQAAYSELYVTDCFWPDFREPELYDAIRSFHGRNRRFGRVEST
jgi:undecaprenyl diphosphate synthase